MVVGLRCRTGRVLAVALFGLLLVPSTFAVSAAGPTVTSCADNGAGSLRDAIGSATSGDTITFQASLNCTIMLASALTIGTDLTIDGTGATIALDGGDAVRVLSVPSGVTATIRSLTIQHGSYFTGSGNQQRRNTDGDEQRHQQQRWGKFRPLPSLAAGSSTAAR